jgi:translation initiation factor IF-1
MTQKQLFRLVVLSGCCFSPAFIAAAAADVEQAHPQLLSGNRVLLGTVEEVRSEQVRINAGDLTSRFVPMGVRKAKDLPELKIGDLVEITVNDQNLLVDVHKAGESGHHRVVPGQLADAMKTGHDAAVIRTMEGKEEFHFVRPVARSKVASMPIGADVIFLIDEMDRIVDVTMGSVESVQRSAALGQQKSPLKGNLTQIAGKILIPLNDHTIVIRMEDGKQHTYHVRPLIQQRLATLFKGDAVVLLLDEENKVTDVAFLPRK